MFAHALKRLVPYVKPGSTMKAKAELLTISPALLSHWLSGRRLPDPKALKRLHDAAVEGACHTAIPALSCSFVELEGLLEAARKSTCRRCRSGCVCCKKKVDRRNVSPSARSGSADRRNAAPTVRRQRDAPQREETLPQYLPGLPLADQVNLLWNLGATLKEEEIGDAISILAGAGMRQEMEIMLRAAESVGRDSVKIVIAASGTR